jgi:type IV pilus modification protein PilV
MSQSVPKRTMAAGGFTLLEVMVALVILTVGLMGMALLMANMYKNTVRSRYMSMAAVLASEKLEELNSYSHTDPHVCDANGTAGSLTVDTPPAVAACASGIQVSYYDTVTLANASSGAVSETYYTWDGTQYQYVTQDFQADGQYRLPESVSAPPPGATFGRRWVVQPNTPVTGVRMVTVLVTLLDQTVQPPVTFQMSMVRP